MKCKWRSPEYPFIQWNGANLEEVKTFLGDAFIINTWNDYIILQGIGYVWQCPVGKYIVKVNEKEFSCIEMDYFEDNYEVLE